MSQMLSRQSRRRSLHRAAGCAAAVAVAAVLGSLTPASGMSGFAASKADHVSARAHVGSRLPAAATRVHHVSPVNASGRLKPAYRVSSSGRGYCWTTSFLTPELYRCFRGNFIMDPCWPRAGDAAVVCLESPWSHDVTRLRLTRQLPETSSGRAALWGLTLGSGLQCAVPGGTRDLWHGHVVNYYCQRHWVLLDSPDRSRATWRILTARYVHGHYHGRGLRPLSDAWRPKGS